MRKEEDIEFLVDSICNMYWCDECPFKRACRGLINKENVDIYKNSTQEEINKALGKIIEYGLKNKCRSLFGIQFK